MVDPNGGRTSRRGQLLLSSNLRRNFSPKPWFAIRRCVFLSSCALPLSKRLAFQLGDSAAVLAVSDWLRADALEDFVVAAA